MGTLASALSVKSLFPLNRKTFGWAFLFVLGLIILFALDLPLLNPKNPGRAHFYPQRWVLLPHVVFGCIALFSGPVQFSTRMRRHYPKFHRILGRFYVGSIMVAAPMGILIPIVVPTDKFFTVGVAVHGALWFITTLVAFLTARNRQIIQHKQWMVRSYVLTFSFITTRILGPLWGAFHITQTEYGMVDVILNLTYLLVTDIALNWREVTTRRA